MHLNQNRFKGLIIYTNVGYTRGEIMEKRSEISDNIKGIILITITIIIQSILGTFACTLHGIESFAAKAIVLFITLGLGLFFVIIYLRDISKNIRRPELTTLMRADYFVSVFHVIHLFALAYIVIYWFDTNSFYGLSFTTAFEMYVDFLYFSVMTFSTVGYGDIHPRSVVAKLVVIIEVLVFVIYISTIVLVFSRSTITHDKGEKE